MQSDVPLVYVYQWGGVDPHWIHIKIVEILQDVDIKAFYYAEPKDGGNLMSVWDQPDYFNPELTDNGIEKLKSKNLMYYEKIRKPYWWTPEKGFKEVNVYTRYGNSPSYWCFLMRLAITTNNNFKSAVFKQAAPSEMLSNLFKKIKALYYGRPYQGYELLSVLDEEPYTFHRQSTEVIQGFDTVEDTNIIEPIETGFRLADIEKFNSDIVPAKNFIYTIG